MPEKVFSNNIWDYLGDMPYLPSRRDRDELVKLAMENPKHEKRLQIWDYFFHIRPVDVGKPQLQEIEALRRQRDRKIEKVRAQARQQSTIAGVVALLVSITAVVAFRLGYQQIELVLDAILLLALAGLFVIWQGSRKEIAAAEQEFNEQETRLRKLILMLQQQIPSPVTVDQMYRWLEEDIDWLTQHALKQTGLEEKRVLLEEDIPNPICIIGPGYLQRAKLIPELLLDPREVDRNKHLAASRLDFFSDQRFIDLYGVYYVEFIIAAEQVLGSYGCFWDFITGRIYNEHTSELYYNDVVALTTRQQFRKVDLSFFKMNLENAPTFSLALSSGDSIQVTYASAEYIRNWHRMLTLSPNGEFNFEANRWVRNPETVAEKAVKALREQLRKHKGTGVEGEARSAAM